MYEKGKTYYAVANVSHQFKNGERITFVEESTRFEGCYVFESQERTYLHGNKGITQVLDTHEISETLPQ